MKRKPQARPETPVPAEIVSPDILAGAKRLLVTDRIKPAAKCIVCSSETAAGAVDQLCWVCRRLKISAWRDVEQQMPAQE